jgi:molybdate transport system substrate-binding protein
MLPAFRPGWLKKPGWRRLRRLQSPNQMGETMEKGLMRALAALLGASILMLALPVLAGEIRVMSSNAFRQAYLELVPEFERSSGHKVVTTFVGGVVLMQRMKAGEDVDLVITAENSIDELMRLGKVVPGSRVDLAKVGVGAAVRAGAPKPDIGSIDALKQALLAARSVGYSTGPSGTYLASLFERMGIADEMKPKIRQAPPGVPVGSLVAKGDIELGFQQLSELLPVAGIELVGMLPPEVQHLTVFSAGLHAGAKEPGAAKALAQFLASPATAATKRNKGMDPG